MAFSDYYVASGQPGDHAPGASAAIRAEFQALQNAFDALPDLDIANAGFLVRVNVSGTGLESFDPSGEFVPVTGGTMSGTLKNTNATALRLVNSAGLIEAYNSAETTRTGFLQFNSAGSVLLRALAPAATGLVFQTEGGSLAIDQTAAAVLNGPSFDITRAAAAASTINLRGNGAAAAAAFSLVHGAASEALLYNRANSYLAIGTNNTERIRVLAAGNVGIGTATPSGSVDIRADIADGPTLILTNRSVSGSTHRYGALLFSGFRDVADPCFGAGVWAQGTSAAANVSDLLFGAVGNNAANTMPTERMRITSGGLVGIGRTPTSKLLEVANGIAAGFGDPESLRIVNDAGYVSFWNSINGTRTGYLQGGAGAAVTLMTDGVPLQLGTSASVRMTISAAGVVSAWDGAALRELGYRDLVNSGATWLGLAQRGQLVSIVAGFTINTTDAVPANAIITIFNNTTGGLTITQGGGMSLFKSGVAGAAGDRTILPRGMMSLWFATTTAVVCSGDCT